MNNPEGYVLVQVKQLAQWREWANNVAAWSTKADRSSEVARLKASISSAMISATQPTASNAGEPDTYDTDLAASRLTQTTKNATLLAGLYKQIEDLTRDRDEWKRQHENLLFVRQQDLAALATKPPAGEQKPALEPTPRIDPEAAVAWHAGAWSVPKTAVMVDGKRWYREDHPQCKPQPEQAAHDSLHGFNREELQDVVNELSIFGHGWAIGKAHEFIRAALATKPQAEQDKKGGV